AAGATGVGQLPGEADRSPHPRSAGGKESGRDGSVPPARRAGHRSAEFAQQDQSARGAVRIDGGKQPAEGASMNENLRSNLVALQTITQREIRRYTRIWPQTLLPPAITMVLYFVIFGNLIGERIGEMGGFRYMDYIVPGLIMMAVI